MAVLVGDPRQLPPTVLSRAAADLGLTVSLFERLARQVRAMPTIPPHYSEVIRACDPPRHWHHQHADTTAWLPDGIYPYQAYSELTGMSECISICDKERDVMPHCACLSCRACVQRCWHAIQHASGGGD